MSESPMPAALRVEGLRVGFRVRGGLFPVIRGIDLELAPGKVLGLLGESGSGKSVTLRSIVGLLPPETTKIEGKVRVGGADIVAMNERSLLDLRGPEVGFIFQEPMTALDPVFSVGSQITETLIRHLGMTAARATARAKELFDLVQIPSAERRLRAYPSELSGGLRQRAMIAMAICCNPKLLLADEPTTALDATVQIQVLVLLRDIQREFGTSMVIVTHDLGVAAEIADDIAVMYAGRIVEKGTAEQVLLAPAHPYTQALTGCVVRGGYGDGALGELAGAPPDLSDIPPGCSFNPRCARRIETCCSSDPQLRSFGAGQMAACLNADRDPPADIRLALPNRAFSRPTS